MSVDQQDKVIKFKASSSAYPDDTITTNGLTEGKAMIEQTALVVNIEGGYAWVLPQQKNGGCSSCSSKSSCASSSPFDFMRREPQKMKVLNPVYARPGDSVVVGMQGEALVIYSLLAYLLPLIGMVLAAMLGHELLRLVGIAGETGIVLAALAGLLGGLRFANMICAGSMGKQGFQPVILRTKGQSVYSSLIPSP